jgi:hypothetical protein
MATGRPVPSQAPTELVESFGTVLDVELVDQVPVAVDDRYGTDPSVAQSTPPKQTMGSFVSASSL